MATECGNCKKVSVQVWDCTVAHFVCKHCGWFRLPEDN